MREIQISDVTMRQYRENPGFIMSFREKLELARLLDQLGVSVIEAEGIEKAKADSLRIKSMASAVKNACLAAPVELNRESVELTWNAIKSAKHPRLQVRAALSTVQMEYIMHVKQAKMDSLLTETISLCRSFTDDVEFVAEDASRADHAFLVSMINTAISAGASTVTVCDDSGKLMPDELCAFLSKLKEDAPMLTKVRLGISLRDTFSLAAACALTAAFEGVSEIKTAACAIDYAPLRDVARLIAARGDERDISCSVRMTHLDYLLAQVGRLCLNGIRNCSSASSAQHAVESLLFTCAGQSAQAVQSGTPSGTYLNGGCDIRHDARQNDIQSDVQSGQELRYLTAFDDRDKVLAMTAELGYELSAADADKVFNAVTDILKHKDTVDMKELDAIVAAEALQVPPAYSIISYLVSAGNVTDCSAHIKLEKDGRKLDGISLGAGPIDAAFCAIEDITKRHFELEDFQIRAISEGGNSLGETIVKLRSGGRIYSGKGISADIIAAGIYAYVNALNKIAYEEGMA